MVIESHGGQLLLDRKQMYEKQEDMKAIKYIQIWRNTNGSGG